MLPEVTGEDIPAREVERFLRQLDRASSATMLARSRGPELADAVALAARDLLQLLPHLAELPGGEPAPPLARLAHALTAPVDELAQALYDGALDLRHRAGARAAAQPGNPSSFPRPDAHDADHSRPESPPFQTDRARGPPPPGWNPAGARARHPQREFFARRIPPPGTPHPNACRIPGLRIFARKFPPGMRLAARCGGGRLGARAR